MRSCDAQNESLSISIDHFKPGIYTRSYLPSQTGADTIASVVASERKGAESQKVELWNLPALEGRRLQGEAKGRRKTPLVQGAITVARPSDAELVLPA
jgi:hypothetical protein